MPNTHHNYIADLAALEVIDLPDAVLDRPESETVVYVALDIHGPIVPIDLLDILGWSEGTLYPALQRLEVAGLVERVPCPTRPGADLAEVTGPTVHPA